MIPLLAPILAKPAVAGAVKFLRDVPGWVWLGVAACIVLLALRWHWIGVGEDRVQARWDAAEVFHAAEAAAATEAALARELRWREDYAAAVSRLTQENADALADRDTLIADLRSGAVRLRDKFRCPSRPVPGPAGAAAGGDDPQGGFLSVQDQEFLVRIGSEADAVARQLAACQAVIRSSHEEP